MRVQTGRKGTDPPSTLKDDSGEDRRLRDVLLQHENVRKVCDVKKLVEYSTKEGWLRFWSSFKIQGGWKNFNRKNFTGVGKTSSSWEKLHRILGLEIFVGKTSSKFFV